MYTIPHGFTFKCNVAIPKKKKITNKTHYIIVMYLIWFFGVDDCCFKTNTYLHFVHFQIYRTFHILTWTCCLFSYDKSDKTIIIDVF